MWSDHPRRRQLGTLTLSDLIRPAERNGIGNFIQGTNNAVMGMMNGGFGPNAGQILQAGNFEAQKRHYGQQNQASALAMMLRGQLDSANQLGVFF